MKPEEVFKRYDIRGKVPEEIDEEFAELIGKAIGTFTERNHSERKVVVTQDTKGSSEKLKHKLIEGIKSTGMNVVDAGEGPTDYASFSSVKENTTAVQVTSSHLALEFNGFKLIYPEGNGFMNADLGDVKETFRERDFEEGEGKLREKSYKQDYLEEAEEFVKDFEGETDRKVVVETMGGAAKDFLPELLERLGFEVVDLAEGEDGPYIDPPNPKPENLEHLENKVKEEDAYLGLATDMDADRLTVYFDGEFLSGDQVFALLGQLVGAGDEVVAAIDTSEAVIETVRTQNSMVHHSRVGDPFLIDKALQEKAIFAGEANGHYCFLDFVAYNSGTVSGAVVAGLDLEEGLEKIPDLHPQKSNIEVEDKEEKMERIKEKVERDYTVLSDIDGVKFELNHAKVLIRSSGSSSVIRIQAEARHKKEAEKALEEAEEIVRNA